MSELSDMRGVSAEITRDLKEPKEQTISFSPFTEQGRTDLSQFNTAFNKQFNDCNRWLQANAGSLVIEENGAAITDDAAPSLSGGVLPEGIVLSGAANESAKEAGLDKPVAANLDKPIIAKPGFSV